MPRRNKRSAWASLTEASPGVWRIRYWAEGPDGYRRRSKTVRGTRKQAEAVRAQLMLEHGEDAPCPTVAQAWERWALPETERRAESGDIAPDTIVQYRRWWGKHVEPTWGKVPCDEVRPLAVQQWLDTLTRSQAANATLVLSKALDCAVRYGCVQTNPMRERYVMPSRTTVAQRDKGIWTLQELEGVWRRLHGTWMEPAFLLAAFGSCRVGESLGVLAGEVELRDVGGVPVALVPIAREVEHHGHRVAERVKTEQSRRTVVMAGKAALRLHELAASMPPDWYLTHDGRGHVVAQARYTDNWRKLGMEHPFRNLRNSWQTWMRWELRVQPHFIERLMGHVERSTTGHFYDRPDADVFADVIADAYRERPYDASWDVGSWD